MFISHSRIPPVFLPLKNNCHPTGKSLLFIIISSNEGVGGVGLTGGVAGVSVEVGLGVDVSGGVGVEGVVGIGIGVGVGLGVNVCVDSSGVACIVGDVATGAGSDSVAGVPMQLATTTNVAKKPSIEMDV